MVLISIDRESSRKRAIVWFSLPTIGLVIGWLGPLWWWFDLFAHFRVHAGVALLLPATLFAVIKSWRWLAASLLVAAYALWFGLPYLNSSPPPRESDRLRILQFNVHHNLGDMSKQVEYLAASQADLILIQEFSPQWLERLEQGVVGYRLAAKQVRSDAFGIALLVRDPIDEVFRLDQVQVPLFPVDDPQIPAIEIIGRLRSTPIAILSLHTVPPMNARMSQLRDQQIRNAAAWAKAQHTPVAIIGDFNATPWCAAFAPFHQAQLRDSARDLGSWPTWPAGFGLFGIPIDHCLTRELAVKSRHLGPSFGSDHRSLLIEL